jgi:hypothetical protein
MHAVGKLEVGGLNGRQFSDKTEDIDYTSAYEVSGVV